MKKFSLLLLSTIMAVCLITSCSDDDDDNKVNNSIVGTWTFKEALVDVKTNNVPTNADAKVKEFMLKELNQDFGGTVLTFNKDNTFIVSYGSEQESGTYTYSNGKLKLVWGVDDYDDYDAPIIDGVLYLTDTLYDDYKTWLNEMDLDDMVYYLGFEDPGFKVEKADYKAMFIRK